MRRRHKFTSSDVAKIRKLGYTISNNIESLDTFINNTFPNLNLLKILQAVEINFTKTTKKKIIRIINYDSVKKVLLVNYNNDTKNIDDALVFVRQFSKIKRTIEVEHIYCILPIIHRGKGYIKPVFQESLQQYLNCGAKRINVHAGLSGGGYTWAKYGFRAVKKNEVKAILDSAKATLNNKEFSICEKIYNGYYGKYPNGKLFPINLWAALDFMKPVLMGSDWHGELDLKNKSHLEKFKDYVYR